MRKAILFAAMILMIGSVAGCNTTGINTAGIGGELRRVTGMN